MKNAKTYRLMRMFYDFSSYEVRIIDHLSDKRVVEATYTELTEAMGLRKSDVSNVRHALLSLRERGIVRVAYKYTEPPKSHNPMAACWLRDDWMENMMENLR